jgi:aquaporin Z
MKKYLAEFIGTFCLVFFGCGTATIAGGAGEAGIIGISLSFGLILAVMVYAFGNISGCHINPAVTIAMTIARKLRGTEAVAYIGMQLLGACAAAGLLLAIQLGQQGFTMNEWALGANGWGPGYGGGYDITAAFITEAVLSFVFIFVILAVTGKTGNSTMAGLAIGLVLVVIHLTGIRVTGVSVNPARSFGPAILAGGKALSQLWLFWVAPIAGACLAAWIWKKWFVIERS